jgi:hypothetical protein
MTVLAFVVLATTSLTFSAETPRRDNYADKYGPLTEHNIFVKERPVKPKPTTQRTSNIAPRTTEESLVLRGVALEDDGTIRAYVEDIDKSQVLKLGEGDAVGRGRIADIQIDAVCYERNGEQIWIDTGADFTGKQVIAITSDSISASGTPTTGPAEVINPNDPNLTIEQKMKLRRLHPELFK